jgi:arginyl-tRNA synthetase
MSGPADLSLLDDEELGLVRIAAQYPRIVEAAAQAHEPHRIAFYLYELASQFHAHWNRVKEEGSLRFVVEADRDLTLSRIALVQAVGFVIQSGLGIFGVPPAEEMR